MLILVQTSYVFVPQAVAVPNAPKTVTKTGTLEFSRDYTDLPADDTIKSAPNVAQALATIDNFDGTAVALDANQALPGFETINVYYFELRLVYVHIINGHDGTGAGDIFFDWTVNDMIDDDMEYNYYSEADLGQYYNGDQGPVNVLLYQGNSIRMHLFFVLRDDDLGIWDTIGYWSGNLNVANQIFHFNNSEMGITLQLTRTQVRTANAQDYIDAFQPYLWIDDEDGNILPYAVWGRAMYGYDSVHGKNGVCLQYIFFWEEERTGTGTLIHNWDFEEVLIYLDFTTWYIPYRFVFDNGFYYETGQDWYDGQRYKIYDADRTSLGYYQTDVEFTEGLKPFLGESRTMQYEWRDIDEIYDSGYENHAVGMYGFETIQLTVETSYHSFDKGEGGDEYGQGYTVDYMNDTVIRTLYGSLDTSFSAGILETYQTPKYSPFSFDLCQPFTIPYIVNNFPTLLHDAAAFNGAKDKKSVDLKLYKDIEVTLSIPYSLSMDMPAEFGPGISQNSEIDFTLLADQAVITVDYWLNLYGNMSLWWLGTKEVDIVAENRIILDLGANTLQFGHFTLELDGSYSGNTGFGSFVDFSITGNLKAVGTLIDAELTVRIAEILKHYLPSYGWILDLVFEDINLVINPKIIGSIDLSLFVDEDEHPLTILDSSTHTIPYSFTPRSIAGGDDELTISLKNFKYHLNFSVDWSLDIDWSNLAKLAAGTDSWTWTIGRWPDAELTLYESAAVHTIVTYVPSKEQTKWQRSDYQSALIAEATTMQVVIIGGCVGAGVGAIALVVVIRKKRRL